MPGLPQNLNGFEHAFRNQLHVDAVIHGLTLVPIFAQLELTLPLSAQLKLTVIPTYPKLTRGCDPKVLKLSTNVSDVLPKVIKLSSEVSECKPLPLSFSLVWRRKMKLKAKFEHGLSHFSFERETPDGFKVGVICAYSRR